MTTSDASWSAKLRIVTELERPDHFHLDSDDRCLFFGTYTAGAGFGHSQTNQLILNLKKKPHLKNTSQWRYKENAIREVGQAIAANIARWNDLTFVPIPPSKRRDSPEYDDRMLRIAQSIGPQADVRDILYTETPREPLHGSNNRRDAEGLRASIAVDHRYAANPRKGIVLLDDVLTTGCTFKVCKSILAMIWPDADIFGMFVARRVPRNPFEAVGAEE